MKFNFLSAAAALAMLSSTDAASAFEYLGHEYQVYSDFIPERMPSLSYAIDGTISPPPPAITYIFRFTSSVPILSAKVGEYGYYYENWYKPMPDGSLQYDGGVDYWNPAAPGGQCIFESFCQSVSFSGKTVIFSITDAPTHTIGAFTDDISETITWLRAEDFTVEVPAGVTGRFTFERLISGVPEPETWALMLLGFGGIGALLRARVRQRVSG